MVTESDKKPNYIKLFFNKKEHFNYRESLIKNKEKRQKTNEKLFKIADRKSSTPKDLVEREEDKSKSVSEKHPAENIDTHYEEISEPHVAIKYAPIHRGRNQKSAYFTVSEGYG